jgi:phosphatidylserine/phosphatidylglycerophosphate/cardiolipin synthase-like enzyme
MRGARDLVFVTFVMILMSPAFHLVPEALHDHAREASSRDVVCSDLCINEVMPNADGSDQGIFPGGEWVELLNSGSVDVSLEGWALVDLGGWHHPINSETWVGFDDLDSPFVLESGKFAIIAENEVGTLRLNNAGETIYLRNSDNNTVHEIVTGEASNGISKVSDPSSPTGTWVDSQIPSPGSENPGEQGGDGGAVDVEASWWDGNFNVKFTRIMPGEVPDRSNDWLEITNLGSDEVSLDGWNISRVRASGLWHSTIVDLTLDAGASVVLTDNPFNLLQDGGIVAQDGNVVLNNMPWLVNSGSSLMLVEPNGTVVDSIVYGGGIAEIEGWTGPAISVPGDGSPGLILMRGSGCGDYPDTDSGTDWEERWIRIGASTFCDGGYFSGSGSSSMTPSIGPDTAFNDLYHWIGLAEESIHLHVYQFMSPDLSHALLGAISRGVDITILLEEGILDGSSTIDNQKGHAQALHDAGATVLWMEDPSQISSPYAYVHSKVAVRDSSSVWISSGNWKDTSLPSDGIGNREWSVIMNSEEAAELVISRLAWDENPNHLHISVHSSVNSPSEGWTMEEANFDGDVAEPYSVQGPFDAQLMTCPDDCVEGIISMIDSAQISIDLSVQYLDLDWYWGFGDNPIIESLYDAANRGVKLRIILNGYYAEWDDEIRDAIHLFNTNWNATEGLDSTARLMASSDNIVKLHNKGAIIDGESVLVGSMNWGSSAALRNREMGVLIHHEELTSSYLSSFNEDWVRLDSDTDSDGDLMPDSWEVEYGLNRHSAAILGTALSEQSLDPDDDGIDNLREFQLGGDPLDPDTDDDCIPDGEEEGFAQSVLRSPTISMTSADVDENGIPDGEQWGCEETEVVDPNEDNETTEPEPEEEEEEDGFINIRDDAMSRPGADFLFGLMALSAIFLLLAGITTFRKPRSSTEEILVDDSGYRFDNAGSELAILKGTSFDEGSEDARALTRGKDDGAHGKIVLDGFGFNREVTTRDEVQWRLDSGQSMDQIRKELGEEE